MNVQVQLMLQLVGLGQWISGSSIPGGLCCREDMVQIAALDIHVHLLGRQRALCLVCLIPQCSLRGLNRFLLERQLQFWVWLRADQDLP